MSTKLNAVIDKECHMMSIGFDQSFRGALMAQWDR